MQPTVFGVHLLILVKFYMFWYTEKIGALLLGPDRSVSTVTAAKMGDVKRRAGMFRVVIACRCWKTFPFSFLKVDSNDAPKTTRRKNVVIGESWIRLAVSCILTNPVGYLLALLAVSARKPSSEQGH